MKCKELFSKLEQYIPIATQESYDNCGLQIGDAETEIKGILYTLDVCKETIDAAVEANCNLIVCHHPFIFKGINSIDFSKTEGQIIKKCVANNINIYAAHTNLDKYSKGVSAYLANKLGLTEQKILQPEKNKLKKLVTFCPETNADNLRNALFNAGAGSIGNYDSCSYNTSGFGTFRANLDCKPFVGKIGELHSESEIRIETVFPSWKQAAILKVLRAYHPYEEVAFDILPLENDLFTTGLGVVGNLEKNINTNDFIDFVKQSLNLKSLRCSLPLDRNVSRVAVCGGTGSSLLETAVFVGADAFVTADIKYHDFQAAKNRIFLVDAGHFETEIFSLQSLCNVISEILPNFAPQIIFSESNWMKVV